MIWLGDRRGYLTDWLTQLWVRGTGRKIVMRDYAWLDGPVGDVRRIGADFLAAHARRRNLEPVESYPRGLVPDFSRLGLGEAVAEPVRRFYEQTSEYEFDVWSEWCGFFRPFGRALALFFSRRLQQLNVPLSPLDTALGISSSVLQWRDPATGDIQTAWVRELQATRNTLYAGAYSVASLPGHPSPCVKVVFPLPNGYAAVLMKTEAHADGSVTLTSSGRGLGDPGFYFVVQAPGGIGWARYVRSLVETIHVYTGEPGVVRADHVLWHFRMRFLRLHYRMRRRTAGSPLTATQLQV